MKVCKPLKVPVLCRIVVDRGQPRLHVAAMLGFSLASPRALVDEIALWPKLTAELGATALDEGITKARGELLVAGSFHVPGGKPLAASYVRVKAGAIDKRLAIFGDRHWESGNPTAPKPLSELRLDWTRAFGGPGDPRNCYGLGTTSVVRNSHEIVPLPNIEPFERLIQRKGERPEPAGFLPMDFSFEQRRALAGTFDADYVTKHAPGLPPDHDPLVYNVAPTDQQIAGLWRGDEALLIEHMNAAHPRIESHLPNLVPRVFVTQRTTEGERFHEINLGLDTVWLLPSIGLGLIMAHGSISIGDAEANDVIHLVAACEAFGERRTLEHYQGALTRRLDKDRGALNDLSDSDLMPPRESGVIPNIDLGEMGAWSQREDYRKQRFHQGAVRQRQRTRDQLVAMGKDPAAFGLDTDLLPPEPTPDPADFDAVAKRVEEQMEQVARLKQESADRAVKHSADSSALLAQHHMTDPMADASAQGGPPAYRAEQHHAELQRSAVAARTAGHPNTDVEAQLASPTFRRKLDELERMSRDGYQRAAHHMPEAAPMTEEANHLTRIIMGFARDSAESLADRDFTGASLRGMDLRGIEFRGAMLEGADFEGSDLSGVNLEGAVLARANLRKANLRGAKLCKANLGGANLEGATFDEADLTEAILMRSTTTAATFRGANLTGADVLESNWRGVDLRGARFERCTFLKADLTGVDLTGAHLVQTTFLECTLDDAVFDGANLHKASIISCKGERTSFVGADLHEAVIVHKSELPDANFTDANLERCCMRTTVFRGARFHGAKMTMSDLSECDASNAKLDRAVLKNALLIRTTLTHASARGVNLNEALLTNARIAGADFSGAQLTRADFMGAVGDDKTRFTEAVVAWTRFDAKASKGAST